MYRMTDSQLINALNNEVMNGHVNPNLSRKNRRQLARAIQNATYHVETSALNKPLVELKRLMSRPPGCAFLGSKATEGTCYLKEYGDNHTKIIFDSGSDITLISQKALSYLSTSTKVHLGLRINLVQVTGSAAISAYVAPDLFFDTPEGLVKLVVEAYVVKGISTPFILGNDFSNQYSLSLIRENGQSHIAFGDSGRNCQWKT